MKARRTTQRQAEKRLCRFRSYVGRFGESLRDDYDYSDPLQAGAAVVNAITQFGGLDPLTRDAGRMLDGKGEAVPSLHGPFARIREDTLGAVQDVFRAKPFSALTKVLNLLGDTAADAADLLAGVHR